MPIQTTCQHCDKAYTLADAMKGKSVKCKNCAKIFVVGGAARAPAPSKATTTGPAKTAPKRPIPEVEEVLAADDDVDEVVAADDDDDLDDRPARRKSKVAVRPKKKGGSGLMWVLLAGGGAFGLLLLVACGGGLWYMLANGTIGTKTLDEAAWRKLKAGMTEAEVIAILGNPTDTDTKGGGKTLTWKQGDNTLSVVFVDGRAFMVGGALTDANGKVSLIFTFATSEVANSTPPPSVPPPANQPPFPQFPPNFPQFPPVGPQPPPPTNLPPPPPPPPPPNQPPPLPVTKPAVPATGPSNVTKASFDAIALGVATFNGVEAAFGAPQSTQKLAGHKGHKDVTKIEYINGKGHLSVWFDNKTGLAFDKDMAGLPDN